MTFNLFKDKSAKTSSVLLIYTGGTIGMKEDPDDGALRPFDFNSLLEEVPELRKFGLTIDSHTFSPLIDSSNVEPSLWQSLARLIQERYEHYQSDEKHDKCKESYDRSVIHIHCSLRASA